MPTNRKPQRPRLETTLSCAIHGRISADERAIILQAPAEERLELRDAKRLDAFLGKAIAYLEARKVRR